MTEPTIATFVVVAVAAFVTGAMKAGLGGGLAPLVTAILVLDLPADVAIGLQLPLLIIGDFAAVGALWRRWHPRLGAILLIGGVVGVGIGTAFLQSIDAEGIRRLVGVVALLFVLMSVIEPSIRRLAAHRPGTAVGVGVGALAGIGSAIAHAGSPPAAMYLLLHRLEPVVYSATMLLLLGTLNIIKVPAYLAAGLFDPGLAVTLLPAIPILVLGTVIGRRFVTRIEKKRFDRAIVGLLFVTGIWLLVG